FVAKFRRHLETVEMTGDAISLQGAKGTRMTRRRILLGDLLDRKGMLVVALGRDRSRHVVVHMGDDNASRLHLAPVIPIFDTVTHSAKLTIARPERSADVRTNAGSGRSRCVEGYRPWYL